jgi:hypothetical protein
MVWPVKLLEEEIGHGAAEHGPGRGGLGDVADVGGGAVGVDVVDALRADAGVAQRQRHRGAHAGLRGGGHVDAVAVGAEAVDLAEDVRAAGERVVAGLEDQGAGALADDQAVAADVEGPRAEVRAVVKVRRGRVHQVEGDRGGVVHLVAAAGDHHVLQAELDRLVGEADRLGAARAGRVGRDDATAHPVELGQVGRAGVGHELEEAGALQPAHVQVDE